MFRRTIEIFEGERIRNVFIFLSRRAEQILFRRKIGSVPIILIVKYFVPMSYFFSRIWFYEKK